MKASEKHRKILSLIIDIFYLFFKNYLSKKLYRYLAVGGICFLINIVVFHCSYNYIYLKYLIGDELLPPYMWALATSLSVTIPTGFYLNTNFVFEDSVLKKRTQFFRYTYTTIISVIVSFILMKFFVEKMGIYPTVAIVLNVIIIQSANYFVQAYFSFKN